MQKRAPESASIDSSYTRIRRRLIRFFAWFTGAAVLLGVFVLCANIYLLQKSKGKISQAASLRTHSLRVAIVLGAGVFPGGKLSDVLVDRLTIAYQLYHQGAVGRILVSGDERPQSNGETGSMQRWLLSRGVPQEHILMDIAGYRTLDTMVRAARVFQVREAVICTQGYHLPRAIFLAKYAGIDAVGVAADLREYQGTNLSSLRESFARTWSLLDVFVLKTEPRVTD